MCIGSALALKLWIFVGVVGGMAAYLGVRAALLKGRWLFFIPTSEAEDRFIRASPENLECVQSTSWTAIADRVATYSSISLGMILVASIFLVAAGPGDLARWEEILFKLVLALAAISVLVYLVSVQLWQEVLGRGWDVDTVLRMRKWASFTRAVGQFTLVGSLLLSMLTVDTAVGTVVSVVAAASVVGFYEYRHYMAKQAAIGRAPQRQPTNDPLPASNPVESGAIT